MSKTRKTQYKRAVERGGKFKNMLLTKEELERCDIIKTRLQAELGFPPNNHQFFIMLLDFYEKNANKRGNQ